MKTTSLALVPALLLGLASAADASEWGEWDETVTAEVTRTHYTCPCNGASSVVTGKPYVSPGADFYVEWDYSYDTYEVCGEDDDKGSSEDWEDCYESTITSSYNPRTMTKMIPEYTSVPVTKTHTSYVTYTTAECDKCAPKTLTKTEYHTMCETPVYAITSTGPVTHTHTMYMTYTTAECDVCKPKTLTSTEYTTMVGTPVYATPAPMTRTHTDYVTYITKECDVCKAQTMTSTAYTTVIETPIFGNPTAAVSATLTAGQSYTRTLTGYSTVTTTVCNANGLCHGATLTQTTYTTTCVTASPTLASTTTSSFTTYTSSGVVVVSPILPSTTSSSTTTTTPTTTSSFTTYTSSGIVVVSPITTSTTSTTTSSFTTFTSSGIVVVSPITTSTTSTSSSSTTITTTSSSSFTTFTSSGTVVVSPISTSTSSSTSSSSTTTDTTSFTTFTSSSTVVVSPITSSTTTSTTTSSAAAATQTIDVTGMTYINAMLTAHNVHRTNHSEVLLAWNQTLADIAAQTASRCVYEHNTSDGGGGYGQNIGAGAAGNAAAGLINNLMYNGEINYYPTPYGNDNPDLSNFGAWGHYSQIVWSDTTVVGCATQYCPNGLQGTAANVPPYFTVCNYEPAGNYVGQFSKVLPPQGGATVVIISS